MGLPFSITGRTTEKLCVLRSKWMGVPGCFIAGPDSVAKPVFTVPLAIGELPVAALVFTEFLVAMDAWYAE